MAGPDGLETRRPRIGFSGRWTHQDQRRMGLLYWTGGPIGHCKLRVVYKMRDRNTTRSFYPHPHRAARGMDARHYGFEVQIDNHPEEGKERRMNITRRGTLYSLRSRWPDRAAGAGMEHDGDHHRWAAYRGVRKRNKVTDIHEGDAVPAMKFTFEPQRGPRPDKDGSDYRTTATMTSCFSRKWR